MFFIIQFASLDSRERNRPIIACRLFLTPLRETADAEVQPGSTHHQGDGRHGNIFGFIGALS
jgi:hypothetical protein